MRTRRTTSSSDSVSSDAPYDESRAENRHLSVLLHEAIRELRIQPQDVVVDATLGGAGHARAIAESLDERGTLIGFDLDHDAIGRAQQALSTARPGIHLINDNFRTIGSALPERGILSIDKALFDLGWSSFQLAVGRGFSFQKDEPLLMTYAQVQSEDSLSAADIINDWAEESLSDILYGWGEERYARRIARAIVVAREKSRVTTSRQLAEIIKACVPSTYRFGRIHPATRTFQALRIAVNDEMGALEEGLRSAWTLLSSGGRIAVITFHSIEDRIVKRQFLAWEKETGGKRITRSPLIALDEELSKNPRARSAKLRVIEKL